MLFAAWLVACSDQGIQQVAPADSPGVEDDTGRAPDTAVDTGSVDTGDSAEVDTEVEDTAPEDTGDSAEPDTGPTSGTVEVFAEPGWLAYPLASGEAPPEDWTSPGFDDSGWDLAAAPAPSECGVGVYAPVEDWEVESGSTWHADDGYGSLFRREYEIPADASAGRAMISVVADDDIAVSINGVEVYREADFGVVEGNTIDWGYADLAPYVVGGANVIALHAQDTIGGCRWAIVSGTIEWTR
jgi:hypothetical protein